MRLEGKRTLVTGATSGLGRAIATRFAREGALVAITGRRDRELAETAELVRKAGAEVLEIVADHTRAEDNARTIDDTVGHYEGLDVLVNSAGIIGYDGVTSPDPDQFRRLMDVNLDAVYDLTCKAVPALLEGRGASIVNMSSVAGLRPYPGLLGYCVSKAAVEMMTKVVALELASKGVRVNAVCPGVIVTELHRSAGMSEVDYAAFLERSRSTHPLGRAGTADEVAALVTFLASDEASFITGASHSIDGGRALTSLR